MRSLRILSFGVLVSLVTASGNESFAQEAAAPAAPGTLWNFLGKPARTAQGALSNRRGNRPRAEGKPALKGLADPANLESENPAIKRAAEIKQAEDLKKQKIKAIKYLTSIGCACYDKDGSITDALIAATDDCTEDVRLTTVQAIAKAAEGGCCGRCGSKCCCKEDMLKKLAEMAYERGDDGCYLEPSARVRQAAAQALRICCPNQSPVIIEPDVSPEPLPVPQPQREGAVEEGQNGTEAGEPETIETMTDYLKRSFTENAPPENGPVRISRGVVIRTAPDHNMAHVHFQNRGQQVPVGTRFTVYHKNGSRYHVVGQVQVSSSRPGSSDIQPIGTTSMVQIRRGDVLRHSAGQQRIASQNSGASRMR